MAYVVSREKKGFSDLPLNQSTSKHVQPLNKATYLVPLVKFPFSTKSIADMSE